MKTIKENGGLWDPMWNSGNKRGLWDMIENCENDNFGKKKRVVRNTWNCGKVKEFSREMSVCK